MRAMKTIVMILALVFTISVAGVASNSGVAVKSQTEKLEMSGTTVTSASHVSKAKKVHHKAHKKASGKKTKK